MKRRDLMLAAGAVLGLGSAALAQFSASDAGPFNSVGAQGNALNGVFTYNYAGADFQIGDITLTGTLTSGDIGSWASEARYRVTTPGGLSFSSAANDLLSGTWTGDRAVSSTQNANILGMGTAGLWTFEFFESFNDGGDNIDAWWTNITFNVAVGVPPPPPPPSFTGSFTGTPNVLSNGVPVSGSTVWTGAEAGMTDGGGEAANFGRYGTFGWDLVGNEVAYRIDHGGGDIQLDLTGLTGDLDMVLLSAGGTTADVIAQSQGFGGTTSESILLAGAAPGTYYVVVDTFGSGDGQSYTLSYIPAPGAVALMGLGGLLAARRRR